MPKDTLVRDQKNDRVEHLRAPLGSGGLSEKQVDFEASTFEAFSAAIGNEDEGRDIIMPGAFRKTVQERLPRGRVKLLDAHRADLIGRVLGKATDAEERALDEAQRQEIAEFLGVDPEEAPTHRLWSQFKVSQKQAAQDALQDVAEGIVDAVSIGYKTVKVEFEKDEDAAEDIDAELAFLRGEGVRKIHELAWWETSLVPWGMNRAAVALPDTVRSALHDVRDLQEGPVSEKDVRWAVRSLKGLIGDTESAAGQAAREVMREACDHLEGAMCECDGKSIPDDARERLALTYRAAKERSEELEAPDFVAWVEDEVKEIDLDAESDEDETEEKDEETEEEKSEEDEDDQPALQEVKESLAGLTETVEQLNERVDALTESEKDETPEGGDEAAGAPDEEKSSDEDDSEEGRSDERFDEEKDDEPTSEKAARLREMELMERETELIEA